MGKAIHTNHQIYDKFLLTRDFNTKDTEPCLLQFLFAYDVNNLVNEKTCLKSKKLTSCINLFITYSSNSFQNTSTMTIGLFTFSKMIATILKTTFLKSKLRVTTYRDYRSFDNNFLKCRFEKLLKSCIVCIGLSILPQKHHPSSSPSLPLNLQTVQAPLFMQFPLYIGFSGTPPKNWIFQMNPHNIKIFHP